MGRSCYSLVQSWLKFHFPPDHVWGVKHEKCHFNSRCTEYLFFYSFVLEIDIVCDFTEPDRLYLLKMNWLRFERLSELLKVFFTSCILVKDWGHFAWSILIEFYCEKVHIFVRPWDNFPLVCHNPWETKFYLTVLRLILQLCSHLSALVILKIFTSEFYSIGALYALYGTGILLTSLLRRQQGNKEFFSEVGDNGVTQKRFRTSGNVVVILTALSIAAYACLLGLTISLENWESLYLLHYIQKLWFKIHLRGSE